MPKRRQSFPGPAISSNSRSRTTPTISQGKDTENEKFSLLKQLKRKFNLSPENLKINLVSPTQEKCYMQVEENKDVTLFFYYLRKEKAETKEREPMGEGRSPRNDKSKEKEKKERKK